MIVGHKAQLDILDRVIRGKKNHHSFLFSGPEGIGKKMIAQRFGYRLTTNAVDGLWTLYDGFDSDLHYIEPEVVEKNKKMVIKDISVEQAREAKKDLSLSADKYAKVLIVNDAHRMTVAAQNALLKTLEEPSAHSYIILVTHNPHKLLPTVRSRCFDLQFTILTDEELLQMDAHESDITDAQGRPGYVHQLHNNPVFRDTVTYARTQLQGLFHKKIHERMALAQELAKKDDDYITLFLTVWIYRIWRAGHATKKYHLLMAAEKIEDLLQTLQKTNINKQLALEDLLIHLV